MENCGGKVTALALETSIPGGFLPEGWPNGWGHSSPSHLRPATWGESPRALAWGSPREVRTLTSLGLRGSPQTQLCSSLCSRQRSARGGVEEVGSSFLSAKRSLLLSDFSATLFHQGSYGREVREKLLCLLWTKSPHQPQLAPPRGTCTLGDLGGR